LNITYVDAHLVKVIKFPMTFVDHQMKGDDPIYKLSVENETFIYAAMR